MRTTHTVTNQPPPRTGHDAYEEDIALGDAVTAFGPGWADDSLHALGRLVGEEHWIEQGRVANENPPQLRTHDRYGHRIDQVAYHPAYHALMDQAVAHGVAAAPWADDRAGAHVVRAARYVLWPRIDSGTLCPSTMTYAAVPSLRHQPDLAAVWEPRMTSGRYDPTFGPAEHKAGALVGMAMTEKQGGSDVRANTTAAVPVEDGGSGAAHRLTGHKWFCSAPMNDAFLVLARLDGGAAPSRFLVPRWLPDGTQNPFLLQRLKDKLGDRSNASSEVEFDGTIGWLVGPPHRGVRVIMDMVTATRLDCVAGAAGWMRHGLDLAAWHVAHRQAFGRRLADQPLMRNVTADLAVESEAAVFLALRLARAFERAPDDPHEGALSRVLTPVAKYWVCKRAPSHVVEALECLGGNGYVEESGLPRLYRQVPLNSIWEGSGNIQCLDVLRAVRTESAVIDALRDELASTAGHHPGLDALVRRTLDGLGDADESSARRITEDLALAVQGAVLLEHADTAVADAFLASRIEERHAGAFGTLPSSVGVEAIVSRTPAGA